ncbi:MAG TPA: hypothetical protein VIY48_21450 [Candidatus Paceibacterota bacterium]
MANKVDAVAPWFIQPPAIVGKLDNTFHKALGREYMFAVAESKVYIGSDRWFMQDRADGFPATLGYLPQSAHTAWPNPGATPNAQFKSGNVYLKALGIGGE